MGQATESGGGEGAVAVGLYLFADGLYLAEGFFGAAIQVNRDDLYGLSGVPDAMHRRVRRPSAGLYQQAGGEIGGSAISQHTVDVWPAARRKRLGHPPGAHTSPRQQTGSGGPATRTTRGGPATARPPPGAGREQPMLGQAIRIRRVAGFGARRCAKNSQTPDPCRPGTKRPACLQGKLGQRTAYDQPGQFHRWLVSLVEARVVHRRDHSGQV